MKYIKLFFFLIYSSFIYTNTVFGTNISCGYNTCDLDQNPFLKLDLPNHTFLDLGTIDSDIDVSNLDDSNPRSLVLKFNTLMDDINLNVNFKSKKSDMDTKNFILIANEVKSLHLNVDGYDGENGEDASIICANKIKNGDLGEEVRNYFINRRTNDSSLDPNRCDNDDVMYLQNNMFSCSNEGYKFYPSDNVEVVKIKEKMRCIGSSIKYKCLKKMVKMTCEWASKARGRVEEGNVSGVIAYPCTPTTGGEDFDRYFSGSPNCYYDYNYSCWHTDLGGAYPAADVEPKWTTVQDLNRCSFPIYGGMFAYQTTDFIPEEFYYSRENGLEEICNQFPHPPYTKWKLERISDFQESTPGLDPESLDPLPGSIWEVTTTELFESCPSYFKPINTIIESWVLYGNKYGDCQDVSLPQDHNNLIAWKAGGLEQDVSFGEDHFYCQKDNCSAQLNIQYLDKSLATLDPTAGANGTSQGNGYIFVYDLFDFSYSNKEGLPGLGGKNDLVEPSSTEYCVKIDDLISQGAGTSFAKNPVVNYNIYNWKVFDINSGQPTGDRGEYVDSNKVLVYKKLDTFTRFLLQKRYEQ